MDALPADIREQAEKWLLWDKNATTREEITKLVEKGDIQELHNRLSKRIAFGTAGLRGPMKAGFSCMNELTVIQASQGLCRYLEHQFADILSTNGVVVGYDGRHNSKSFAEWTAATFLSQGVPVQLFSRVVPTPFVAFATPLLKCAAGVMVTASHNPKEDNGYKVYWNNGCQINVPHDKGIADLISQNLVPWNNDKAALLQIFASQLHDPLDKVSEAYYKEISKYCFHKEDNAKSTFKITYTAMHGVGADYVADIPVNEQIKPDPEFPTVAFPNPEEGKGALKLAIQTAEKTGSTLILATDPDADRLAVAEKLADLVRQHQTPKLKNGTWKIYTGNEIGALLGHWTWTKFREANPQIPPSECVMINSTVSSKFLSSMAAREGFQYEETLTGFKWLGGLGEQRVREGKHLIFAFEEAIGNVTYDKDGVRCAAVFSEMAIYLHSKLSSPYQYLQNLYKQYGYFITSNRYFFCYDPIKLETIFNRIRNYDNSGKYPPKCGKYPVKRVRDLTTGHDDGQPDKKAVLPTSSSTQMITFFFENGCVATLRGSGTEPKLKYYIELNGADREQVQIVLDGNIYKKIATRLDMVKSVIETCLKPTENGLIPPAD